MLQEGFHFRSESIARRSRIFESDRGQIAAALRFDAAILATTAVECFVEARNRRRDDRAIAWAVIKAYYASYFAAHSLLRLFGQASLWADSAHVSALRRVSTAWLGVVGECPDRGLWRVKADHDFSWVEIEGVGGSRGGSHEGFWDHVSDFLDEVSSGLAASNFLVPADVQFSILRIQALRSYIDSGRLVKCRHDVNYRRKHGVWFPYAGFDPECAGAPLLLSKRLESADVELTLDLGCSGELISALQCGRGLLSLLLELLSLASKLGPDAARDLQAGVLRLSRHYRLI